jgi:hypothetical protein
MFIMGVFNDGQIDLFPTKETNVKLPMTEREKELQQQAAPKVVSHMDALGLFKPPVGRWIWTFDRSEEAEFASYGQYLVDKRESGARPGTIWGGPKGLTRLQNEWYSTAAECAAARLLHLDWEFSYTPNGKAGDIPYPFPIDVRWTPDLSRCLYIKPSDPPRRAFISMTGYWPTFTAQGFMVAKDVQGHDEWLRPDNPYGKENWHYPRDLPMGKMEKLEEAVERRLRELDNA